MRLPTFVVLFLMISAISASAQSNCSTFFPFEKGVELEYAYFDKKGRPEGTSAQKVTLVEEGTEGLTAVVETQLTDKKGKETIDGEYKVTCKDNTLYMDVSSMLPAETMASFSSLDVSITGEALQLPPTLEVGAILPDATTEIKAGTNGMNLMTMTVTITDRKVEAKEQIQTPAGTFDCYKITHSMESKMLISRSFQVADWYAVGVGVVKSETYDKNGNLESSMELQRFQKM